MDIRPATHEDAEALSRLAVTGYTDTFGHLYTKENLDSHMEKTCSPAYFRQALDEGDVILLAFVEEQLAGYVKAGALGLPVQGAENASELHRLYVLEAYHGQQIGRALMEAAMALPPLNGASEIYLGVWENNVKAQQFYARYGFKPHGEYLYYVGTHADREFIYKRGQDA